VIVQARKLQVYVRDQYKGPRIICGQPLAHFATELSLSYGRRPVDQFVLVSGSPLGPRTRFYPYPFFSDNCFVVLHVERPLWREDGSVTYSATADWSGHWGPITIQYRLIWDCVPSSSPLTTRRDCGGGILTRLHTRYFTTVMRWRAVVLKRLAVTFVQGSCNLLTLAGKILGFLK
jgi:hypothetical protein